MPKPKKGNWRKLSAKEIGKQKGYVKKLLKEKFGNKKISELSKGEKRELRKKVAERERKSIGGKYKGDWRKSEEYMKQWRRQGNKQLKRLSKAKKEYKKLEPVKKLGEIEFTPAESEVLKELRNAKTLPLKVRCMDSLGKVGAQNSIPTLLLFLDPHSAHLKGIAREGLPEFKKNLLKEMEREAELIQRGEAKKFVQEAIKNLREKGKNGGFYKSRKLFACMFCAANSLTKIVRRFKQLPETTIGNIQRAARNASKRHPKVEKAVQELLAELKKFE